jgi:hypothetical protein
MKIGPSGSVCLSLMGARRSDARPFSKSPPTLAASHVAQGFTLGPSPEAPRAGRLFRRGSSPVGSAPEIKERTQIRDKLFPSRAGYEERLDFQSGVRSSLRRGKKLNCFMAEFRCAK